MRKILNFSLLFFLLIVIVHLIRFKYNDNYLERTPSSSRLLSAIKEKFCKGILIGQNSTVSSSERDDARTNRESMQIIRNDNQIRKAFKTQNFEEYGTGLIPYCAPWIAMLAISFLSFMMYCLCSVCNM